MDSFKYGTRPVNVASHASNSRMINVLLTSFAGLSCRRTTCIPFAADTTVSSVYQEIYERLPSQARGTILTGTDNTVIDSTSSDTLARLIAHDEQFVTLQIRGRLLGGKGGFGSQLRAAGGRMSSRKKRNNQQDVNGSNRNLDGRRLRTITEAKNLAEYLVMKPEMERKEREERRKRWEAVIDMAEKKQEELRDGKSKVRLDGEWVDAKEEAETRTRDAVLAAMRSAGADMSEVASGSDSVESGTAGDAVDGPLFLSSKSNSAEDDGKRGEPTAIKALYGWDDEEMESEDEDEDEDETTRAVRDRDITAWEGKGKALVV